jgi:N4-gp56 family major capsid protein
MYTEVKSNDNIAVKQWEASVYREYIGELWMRFLMGQSTNAVIQVKKDLTKKKGDQITFTLRSKLQGGVVTGSNKGEGNEGKIDFFSDSVIVDNVRVLAKIQNVPMTEQRVKFSVPVEMKDALVDASKEKLEDDIITALTDTSTGRVRGRYLYGLTDSNWNATHSTALQNIDNTADQLTLNMIGIAKRKAKIPVNATAKIRPMKIVSGKNIEYWYIFVGHTYAIRDLCENDPALKNTNYFLPPAQVRLSPLFTGSDFKGAYRGVLVYEYEKIPLVSSTIQCAHNLFLGAQAAAVAWAQTSKYREETYDYGHDLGGEIHEIRGVKKLVFNRTTPEDQGVIHVFSAAVAD